MIFMKNNELQSDFLQCTRLVSEVSWWPYNNYFGLFWCSNEFYSKKKSLLQITTKRKKDCNLLFTMNRDVDKAIAGQSLLAKWLDMHFFCPFKDLPGLT